MKTIKDWIVVLQSLDGSNQVWTERGNLKLFYKKVEREEVLNMPLSPAMKRPLRSPSKVVIDLLQGRLVYPQKLLQLEDYEPLVGSRTIERIQKKAPAEKSN